MGLGWPWKTLGALLLVPRPVRDAVYALVARNRYRLMGRRDVCRIPEPSWRARFLDA
jgi:predicted DCC family thiol-disulfide oxidoreductase YuxK